MVRISIALFAFLATAVAVLNAQELTVESIWKNYAFSSARFEGFRSMKDGKHFTRLVEKEGKQYIAKFAILDPKNSVETLVSSDKLIHNAKTIRIENYYFNDSEQKVLITTETKPIYRRSFSANYFLFDLKSQSLQPLDEKHQPQTLAEYSPDGQLVSYIHKNDLYVKTLSTGKVVQLTKDGKKNKVINGTTDWVYEEEFELTKAYAWSPDSKNIAFLRFNEKSVQEFSMTLYGGLYPKNQTFKYPKAGEKNSKVTAHIIDVKAKKILGLNLGEYEYIPRLKWSPTENKLVLQTLNRHQNLLKYHLIDLTKKKAHQKIIFEEKSDTYVEIDNNLLILKDGNTLLRTSELDGFNHIYKLSFTGENQQITKGNWDVIEFYGIDENSGKIYYSSAEKSPIYKGIYRIHLDGTNKQALSKETGTNDADFTSGMHYFVKSYSTANTPPVYTLCANDGVELSTLETNQKLVSILQQQQLSTKEFISIKAGETSLNGWMIKPQNFDASKKYPVFVTVYGGPGSNKVKDAWEGNDYMYHQLLAQKGYIVVSVDPRGTMYRGASFKKCTYLQLGKLETEDMILTAKELQKMPFVDPSRIGIQGWSYGGFMSSLAITKGADYFKMAIAVAPVTNWKYYDNIYTERFMRTPQENPTGYAENSPINFVNQLKGKYLLIHGSADDNVHYQNTMEMIQALVKEDKQFDLFIYPNKNHGIYGGNTRNHLFNLMLKFTVENL
jgi:dipeptidyl-peptidase-4